MPKKPVEDFPFYWFLQFEEAIKAGNLERAVAAQRQLKAFGLTVAYQPTVNPLVRKEVALAR